MHLFFLLDEFSVLILTAKRENEKSVCVMWRVMNGSAGTLHSNWPLIGCQVCILTNEVVTCGLDVACVALDLKLDQSAINETKGTVLQI